MTALQEATVRELLTTVCPDAGAAASYRASGLWRDTTFTDDLRRLAREIPHAVALVNRRGRHGREEILTFQQLADRTGRIAAGLRALGVRRGDVVAVQLPCWWETAVLTLACDRLGAVTALLLPDTGPRELERALAVTGACILVLADVAEGASGVEAAASMAGRLPALRHRVVLGGAVAGGAAVATRALDFTTSLLRCTDPLPDPTPLHPDAVSLVTFASGITGTVTGVMHTPNTLHAAVAAPAHHGGGGGRAASQAVASSQSHVLGHVRNTLHPLVNRAPAHYADVWDASVFLDMLARNRTERIFASARQLTQLAAEQHQRPRPLNGLRMVVNTSMPLSREPASLIRDVLCSRLVNSWGTTGIGRARTGVELRLDAEPGAPAGVSRLFVRSASTCLATFEGDSGRLRWDSAGTGGWFDTGDLVTQDGRDGLRLVGRAADHVGSGAWMVPARDVEEEPLGSPAVQDAAVIGHPDPAAQDD
ncbi:AMP-binding protein [Streptomyces rectiverticillatus]|uniref:AMP-binding protein n=1 Tax=Streptomyces rectiverticillatus TaxID=173860 RepID=UPI0015C3A0B5|nr:AMP-binding protein [Streptomyces rectiverticillatus]